MTAVIFDGKTLAADRRVMAGNAIVSDDCLKIEKWEKGYFAIAGIHGTSDMVRKWLERKGEITCKKGDIEVLYTNGNHVYYFKAGSYPYEAFVPYGIGSGGTDCEALCRIGYTGKDAIKQVMKYIPSVGGKIDVVRIGK